ncbi:serine/threonine protein kinase [Singulisphaera acidiphila]|uniref:serine/threonine protein kinase n=1 Tax=Singulisphaera acidiphila TaxID=466153 RepID=UPI00024723B9|nr:hypothetical protein [Singulisphaera acidiphila]
MIAPAIRSLWEEATHEHRSPDESHVAVSQYVAEWLEQVRQPLPATAPPLENLTRFGAILGTPEYMAPEQMCGNTDSTGPRADLYALGVTMYQMLVGHRPNAVIQYEAGVHYPLPSRTRVSSELEAICNQCLRYRAEDRYPHVGELVADLDRFLGGYAVVAALPECAGAVGPNRSAKTETAPGTTVAQSHPQESTRSWWPLSRRKVSRKES